MLTYLSASTLHLTLSTYDAFSQLDFPSANRIPALHPICWCGGWRRMNGEAESDWRMIYADRMASVAAS